MKIDFIFVFLNFLLLLFFFLCGNEIAQKKNYWNNAFLCILFFVFVQGSRYGRGNDYFLYVDRYKYGLEWYRNEPVYELVNSTLRYLGVGPHFFLYFYALLFITCAFVFFKRYIKIAHWLLPLFIISYLLFHEYQIRQALSFSFVWLLISQLAKIDKYGKISVLCKCLRKKNFYLLLFFFLLAIGIHKANFIFIVVIVCFYYVIKNPISYKITIPSLIICTFFIEPYIDFSFFKPILGVIEDQNSLMNYYANNSDQWLGQDAMDDKYARKTLVQIFECWGIAALYYFGYKILRKSKDMVAITFFNIYVVGGLIMIAFRKLEILNRIGYDMYILGFLPLALVLYYRHKLFLSFYEKMLSIGLLFFAYDYLRYLLFPKLSFTRFIWDVL